MLLCFVALFATGIVACPPALALKERYIVGGAELGANETVEGGVSTVAIQTEWNANTQLRIECTTNKLQAAQIELLGVSKEELILEGCKNGVSEIKGGTKTSLAGKCEVSNKPALMITGALGKNEQTGTILNILKPAVGANFGEVEIKEVAGGGGCAYGAAGGSKYKIEGGFALAWFGPNGEVEALEHELIFFPTCGSQITFATKRASLEVTVSKIKLNGAKVGKNWSVG
jgi:hypothetical protein